MKRLTAAIFSLALIILVFASPAVTQAAQGAVCWADDYELSIGEVTGVYCSGFSPNTVVNVYYASPGGVAGAYLNVKTDANGIAAFAWGNGVKGEYSYQLGIYTLVVQQLGLNKTIERYGTVEIKNSGAGDAVSGASLVGDKSVIDDRPNEVVNFVGTGFAPNEVVTVWAQRPVMCDSVVWHYDTGGNGTKFANFGIPDDISAYYVDSWTADASGTVEFYVYFTNASCAGTHRIVARGNTSGRGAETDITVTGLSVSTNAWLTPSSDSVGAMFDTIQFYASGFAPNEILNCWTTSPDGRALPYGYTGSLGTIKVGADGAGVITFHTGSDWVHGNIFDYASLNVSELPGVWKLTCRGATSDATAIGEFTIHGYETAP